MFFRASKNLVWIATCAVAGMATAELMPAVNFTLSLDTRTDPGATYTSFHEADAGTGDAFVIGFQIAINSIDGKALNLPPVAAFCSELEEPISTGTYTFSAANLCGLAAGQAGVAGTASSAIPAGGIGHQRAADVNYLFDQYYISEVLSSWTVTRSEPTTQAFQLALWELTHDDDLSLSDTSGEIYVGRQRNRQRDNAIALAQSMLDTVRDANVSDSYLSSKFSIWALVNDGLQDVILATEKGSDTDLAIEPLLPVATLPEPTTQALIGLSAGIFWFIRRFQRA
jgi:hypothetical protein